MVRDFKISKTQGVCTQCEKPIEPGEEIYALVRAGQEELERQDFHLKCFLNFLNNDSADIDALDENDGSDDAACDDALREALIESMQNDPNVLGIWKTHIPHPEEKKKLLIDNALLVNFFERLEGHTEPSKLKFRYVLTLILMRKRLLNYEGMTTTDGVDLWKMRVRGTDRYYQVIDPKLDKDQISEVSSSLGEIMEGDFE